MVEVSYLPGGGNHGTTIVLLWQIVGIDADFVHSTPVIVDGHSVGPFATGQTINFKTRASNSTGDSDVKSITL